MQKIKQKIALLIPVLNEEGSIGHVLSDIPRDLIDEIIVVDNGSSDNSEAVARFYGATVLKEPEKGYGAACLKGIEYLKNQIVRPDVLVFLDGDYSDYPEQTTELIKKLNEGYDFVLGSRIMGIEKYGAHLSRHSVMGNKLAAFFLKIMFRGNYTDLGPFRAIRFEKLLELGMCDQNYGWTMEMQIKALRDNLKITEIPVHYRKRLAGNSKVTGSFWGSVKACIKISKTVFEYFMKMK